MKEYLKRLDDSLFFAIYQNEYHLNELLRLDFSTDVKNNLENKEYLVQQSDEVFFRRILENPKYIAVICSTMTDEEISSFSNIFFSRQLSKKQTMSSLLKININNKRNQKKLHDFFNIPVENEDEVWNLERLIEPQHERFYELLNYQYVAKEQILSVIESNINMPRMILHMPTGTGKTKTAVHTIIHDYIFNRGKCGTIIWLAHTIELLYQAYNAFKTVWGTLADGKITVHFNELSTFESKTAIYFVSYQKLISFRKKNNDAYKTFRKNTAIIVTDEAHKCLAKETRIAVEGLMVEFETKNYQRRYLLGLTATPGRKLFTFDDNNENEGLSDMFEKRIISIDPDKIELLRSEENPFDEKMLDVVSENDSKIIRYFQENHVLSTIEREEIQYTLKSGSDPTQSIRKIVSTKGDYNYEVLNKISEIPDRNLAIIKRLIELDTQKTPTIVFACSVKHGQFIENALTLLNIKSKGVYGHTKSSTRKQIIEDFNDELFSILINYEVLTTGFDSPRIQCVFITRPTNSIVLYSQMLGRGLRGPRMGGNATCLLIDIRDNLEKFSDENQAFSYFTEYWGGN
jgi:DNA repair protein RadD